MIDAYTIGITLALNNGVADGIAAVRRDLASLDRAVDASAAGLAQLRAAAGSSVTAASADLARLVESARRAAAGLSKPSAEMPFTDAPPQTPEPRERSPEAQEPQARTAPPLAPATRGELPVSAVPEAASPATTATQPAPKPNAAAASPRAVPPAGPTVVKTESKTAPRVISAPVRPTPGALPDPRSLSPAPPGTAEPAAPAPREIKQHPRLSADVPAIEYAALARAMSPQPAPDAIRPLTTHHIERTHAETRTTIREREIAVPALVNAAPSVTQALPLQSVPPQGALQLAPAIAEVSPTPPRSEPAAAAIAPVARHRAAQDEPRGVMLPKALSSGLPSAARPQPSTARPSTTVEVVLDGATIGRWMDERLARVATRPASGVTGFDPRLSPVWPTAPIAN